MRVIDRDGSLAYGFGNIDKMDCVAMGEPDIETFVGKIIQDKALESENCLYGVGGGYHIYIGYPDK
jgi:hypothetical protein